MFVILTLLDPGGRGGFRHFGVSLLISAEPEMPRFWNFVTFNIYLFYISYTSFELIEFSIVTSSLFFVETHRQNSYKL